MRSYRLALALSVLQEAIAVSLDDFTPRPSSLPAACQKVYTESITGCTADDWTSGTSKGCSKGCVSALQGLSSDVKKACANQGVTGTNIIVAFLEGDGPQSLCSNANQYLPSADRSSSSAASTPTAYSRSSQQIMQSTLTSTTSASAQTSSISQSASSTTLSGTVTATSLATTAASTDLAVDTATQSTRSPTSSSHESSQTNMADSGGGSPFDSTGNTNVGASLSCNRYSSTLLTALLVFVMALR